MTWKYIAPHRIRIETPTRHEWEVLKDLSIQRLARVFEFQTTVAFLGSGCSAALGYPAWKELLPPDAHADLGEPATTLINALRTRNQVDIEWPSALQIAQEAEGSKTFRSRFTKEIVELFNKARTHAKGRTDRDNPFIQLLNLPLRRFITTNYDGEMEIALTSTRGNPEWTPVPSFDQSDRSRLPLFGLALAPGSRNMIFHCHGQLEMEPSEGSGPRYKSAESQAGFFKNGVLLEDDYKRWYLSEEGEAATFRAILSVILHSNPLLIVGYSMGDADLVRRLRQLAVRNDRRPAASDVFILLAHESAEGEEFLNQQIKFRAWQSRFGINVIDYRLWTKTDEARPEGARTLAEKLCEIRELTRQERALWRMQPKARHLKTFSGYLALAHKGLFTDDDPFTRKLADVVDRHSVVFVLGEAGSAKFIKLCHFYWQWPGRKFFFSGHGNDDVYSYIKRVVATLTGGKDWKIQALCEHFPENTSGGDLIVLTGLERLLDYYQPDEDDGPKPYSNGLVKNFLAFLMSWSQRPNVARIVLSSRSLPWSVKEQNLKPVGQLVIDETTEPFSAVSLKLSESEYATLQWRLRGQHSAMVMCAAYLNSRSTDCERESALTDLISILSPAPSERGTRIVRHIVRHAFTDQNAEIALAMLSYFNRPVSREIVEHVFLSRYLHALAEDQRDELLRRLVSLCLVEEVVPAGREGPHLYYVSPLARRYCRTIISGASHVDSRSFGLHGYTARGPFVDPGTIRPELARELFSLFESAARDEIGRLPDNSTKDEAQHARRLTRAAFEILRSTFTCNSVPRWGRFSDYILMCARCYDLVRNYSEKLNELWSPPHAKHGAHLSDAAPLTPEEVIWILNELGLAYYSEGTVQDAISIWQVAFDWQKMIVSEDPAQADMYAASLNCHLGAAHMQIGRMDSAREYFQKGMAMALSSKNQDLQERLRGFLARVDHAQGDLKGAAAVFRDVIRKLGKTGNSRARCYFMRHYVAVLLRQKKLDEAERTAQAGMAMSAGEGYPDFVGYSREIVARLHAERREFNDAIREFLIAQEEAKKLGIYRLEIDALLGLAKVQLHFGDAHAARSRAFEALKIANECLLVQRQIRALMLIGQAEATLGDKEMGIAYVVTARDRAIGSGFRLTELDASQLLARMEYSGAAS